MIGMIVAGSILVIVLVCVATYYHWKLWQRKKEIKRAETALQEKIDAYREGHAQSIRVITQAYVSGQVELAEACLRLSKLMDMLEWQGDLRQPYLVIDKMAESIAHIPTLERWKSLPKIERRKFEAYISSQESSFEPFAKTAIEALGKDENLPRVK